MLHTESLGVQKAIIGSRIELATCAINSYEQELEKLRDSTYFFGLPSEVHYQPYMAYGHV